MSMRALREWLNANPDERKRVLQFNESFVFFRQSAGTPVGSLGVPLTPGLFPVQSTGAGARQDAVRRRRRDHRRGQAGSTEVAPGHQLLCRFDCRVRQAQPRSWLCCRQRRPSVFCLRHLCRVRATKLSGPKAARTPAFKWVNTALGNIKAAITGTYRAINSKHVPRYLAEVEYRFNRRYDLAAMIPRLAWAAVRTTPMPYRLLKLAEVYA